MATPKGMRAVPTKVSATDAIHIYSDDDHIWLQLRRKVPTEQAIGKPSFKVALALQIGTAQKLGQELLKIVEDNKARQKAKNSATAKSSRSKPKQL